MCAKAMLLTRLNDVLDKRHKGLLIRRSSEVGQCIQGFLLVLVHLLAGIGHAWRLPDKSQHFLSLKRVFSVMPNNVQHLLLLLDRGLLQGMDHGQGEVAGSEVHTQRLA